MIDVATFTLEEARALPEEVESGSGVYFLWRAGELLYIGSGVKNVMDRVAEQVRHKRFGKLNGNRHRSIPFDRYTVLACASDEARDIELALLGKFGRPEYNHGLVPGDPG